MDEKIPVDILNQWLKLVERSDVSPWEPDFDDQQADIPVWSGKIKCGLQTTFNYTIWEPKPGACKLNTANWKFICCARTAMPLLIDAVRQLQREIEELKK